jgi:hypothetical protein
MAAGGGGAYDRMRGESQQGADQKMAAQQGGPMGQAPPPMGGGESPGAGQYRPGRM